MDELQDSAKIKAKTLYEINNRLQKGEIDIDSPIEAIVTDAYSFITEQEVAKVREEEAQKFKAKAEDLKTQYNQGLKQIKNQSENDLTSAKAENIRLGLEKEKALQQANEESKSALAKKDKEHAEKLADRFLPRTMRLYWGIAILLTVGLVGFILFTISLILNTPNNKFDARTQVLLNFVFAMIPIGYGILEGLIIQKGLCGLEKDKVRQRLIDKYSV